MGNYGNLFLWSAETLPCQFSGLVLLIDIDRADSVSGMDFTQYFSVRAGPPNRYIKDRR